MKEICKIQATKKINKALRTQNGPSIIHIHDFSLNNPILMYKEKKKNKKNLINSLALKAKQLRP